MNKRFKKFGPAVGIHAACLLIAAAIARFTDGNFIVYSASDTFRYFLVVLASTVFAGLIFELFLLKKSEEGTQADFHTRFFLPIMTTAIYTGFAMPNHNVIGLLFGPILTLPKLLTVAFALIYIVATNALCAWLSVSLETKQEGFSFRLKSYGLAGGITAIVAIIISNIIASHQTWYGFLYFEERDVVKYYIVTLFCLFLPTIIGKGLHELKHTGLDSFRTMFSDFVIASLACLFFTSGTCGTTKNIFALHTMEDYSSVGWFLLAYGVVAVIGLFVRFRFVSRSNEIVQTKAAPQAAPRDMPTEMFG